jgi:hypothetical protein
MSKLRVPPNMAHFIDNARKLQELATFSEWKTITQGHLLEDNSFDMIDGSNTHFDQEFQDEVKTGGVCTCKPSRNTEHGKST